MSRGQGKTGRGVIHYIFCLSIRGKYLNLLKTPLMGQSAEKDVNFIYVRPKKKLQLFLRHFLEKTDEAGRFFFFFFFSPKNR